ncbi:MBL fold metallo-hydrolase [Nocardia caishijiensis]|uniref:L-ascorbate metabolism protein UlaG (Beta-lactamase superfamily) n=1 Tax=Nocardia caishijiensis TaxID=184756 RepID=A0ABQ6YJH1_9NOCA|nr:MBL fold metallo-hydrolase [Nocardia caishijiensis]KAF0845949.1 L-ascorbate metabolism protein UlaG (beta-lactamase superfamily) [Nocardia caishijiensis]
MSVSIASLGHSTVRLTVGDGVVVVDPGTLAPSQAFDDVAAFLITHDHDDHVDIARVTAAPAARPSTRVLAPQPVIDKLVAAGGQLEGAVESTRFDIAGFAVRPIVGDHAAIHPSLPDSPNVAYLIDNRILHPGDAFPDLPDGTALDVLFLPVSGPWMRYADAVDYVDATRPGLVVPIHDGDLDDVGRTLTDQLAGLLPDTVRYQRLELDAPITV